MQAATLLVGIFKIKKLISMSGYKRMVNNKVFFLHAVLFLTYLVTQVLIYITALLYYIDSLT